MKLNLRVTSCSSYLLLCNKTSQTYWPKTTYLLIILQIGQGLIGTVHQLHVASRGWLDWSWRMHFQGALSKVIGKLALTVSGKLSWDLAGASTWPVQITSLGFSQHGGLIALRLLKHPLALIEHNCGSCQTFIIPGFRSPTMLLLPQSIS